MDKITLDGTIIVYESSKIGGFLELFLPAQIKGRVISLAKRLEEFDERKEMKVMFTGNAVLEIMLNWGTTKEGWVTNKKIWEGTGNILVRSTSEMVPSNNYQNRYRAWSYRNLIYCQEQIPETIIGNANVTIYPT